MAEQKMMLDVQDWDLTNYPEVDPRDGKPGSAWFKLQFLTKDGMVDAKTIKTMAPTTVMQPDGSIVAVTQTIEKKVGRREYLVTGGIGTPGAKKDLQGQPSSKIEPQDLKKAEIEIQGKPTVVLMGLFWQPVYDPDTLEIAEWVPQDRKKTIPPLFWRDVTEDYYQTWRPEAYKIGVDPFKGMQRPYTRLQELMQTGKVQIDEKDKEIARLKAELAAKSK